ncbi:MAG: TetR/AcrR family transcriptional regulator [Acidobacteriota bacterium]|nr:TetR/AcrR family transcriptional regulator [Acidobacteriota bacterium]
MAKKAFASILEPRKADIVSAVLRLVDRVGITGLTTKLIAKEVGFTEGALYKHVRSKNDIFRLILDSSGLSIEALSQDISKRGLGPEQSLRAWFDFAVSFLEDYPGVYRILFSDGLYTGEKAMFKQFKDCMFDLLSRIQSVIERGIAEKVLWPDLNPASNAVMFLGVIHTTFTFWTVFENRVRSYKKTAQPYFEEYLRSLRIPSREAAHG